MSFACMILYACYKRTWVDGNQRARWFEQCRQRGCICECAAATRITLDCNPNRARASRGFATCNIWVASECTTSHVVGATSGSDSARGRGSPPALLSIGMLVFLRLSKMHALGSDGCLCARFRCGFRDAAARRTVRTPVPPRLSGTSRPPTPRPGPGDLLERGAEIHPRAARPRVRTPTRPRFRIPREYHNGWNEASSGAFLLIDEPLIPRRARCARAPDLSTKTALLLSMSLLTPYTGIMMLGKVGPFAYHRRQAG